MIREQVDPGEWLIFGSSAQYYPHWNDDGTRSSWCNAWGFPLNGPPQDKFGHDFIGQGEIFSPPIDPSRLIGALTALSDKPVQVQWLGLPPVQTDRNIPDGVGAASAVLNTAANFLTGRWGNFRVPLTDPNLILNEHEVCHTNMIGEVVSPHQGSTQRPLIGSYVGKPGYAAPQKNVLFKRITGEDGSSLLQMQAAGGGQSFVTWYGNQSRSPWYHLHLGTPFYLTYGDPSFGNSGTYVSEFQFLFTDPTTISGVDYRVQRYAVVGDWNYFSSYVVNVNFDWLVYPKVGYVIGTYLTDIHNFVKMRARYVSRGLLKFRQKRIFPYTYENLSVSSVDYSFLNKTFTSHWNNCGGSSFESVLKSTKKMDGSYEPSHASYNLLREFDRRVAAESRRLYPAVFYSAKEAHERQIEQVEANHLENLTQLGSVVDLIDPIVGFINLAGNIKRKDVNGTVLALFDLLTDAQLLYSYGIAPTISDAQEISEMAGPLNEKWIRQENLFGYRTYNGKFTFDVPDDVIPPYTGIKLVARSKVRAAFNKNSILGTLMPVKAFGLLPTLSNMWDLIPFSFVADWFTNIGGKLEAVDANMTMLAFDIHFVTSSMMLYWTVDNEILTDKSVLAGLGDAYPTFKFFVRDVSTTLPALTFTDIDFQPPAGLPNWRVWGSLAYKLIRR